jgi:signal transduction histidine kinase
MTIGVQSALIGVLVIVAVAVEMLLRRRNRRSDVLFVIFAANIVAWLFTTFLRGTRGGELWLRAELAIGAVVPVTLLVLFAELVRGTDHTARALRAFCYPLATIVAIATFSPLGELEPVQLTAAGFTLAMILLIAREMLQSSALARGTVDYARLRYLAFGAVFATLLVFVGRVPGLVAWVGDWAVATGHAAVMLYVFFLAQVITRDRLLDLQEFVVRVVVVAAMAILFATISTVLVVGLGNDPALRLFNTVVAVVVLVVLYEPLKERLEAKTVEFVFRERHTFSTLLESLRRRMLRVLDPERMSALVLDTLYDSRRATHAAVYLLDPVGRELRLLAFRGPEPAQRVAEDELPDLWHAIQQRRAPLLAEQLLGAGSGDERTKNRDLVAALRQVSADVLLPFVSGDKILGFLALRDDRVAEPYATEEIALLMGVSEAAVIVLENSQLAQRLRERDRLAAIGEMAAGLAHEIRNPLGAIKGAAEYLEPSRSSSKDDAELLQVIVEEANRLNSVVSQFLDYARPFRATLAPTGLNEIVRKTAKLVEAREGQPQALVTLVLDPQLPPIEVDAEQVKQVLLNLVINAIEATGDRGTPVEIATRYLPERDRVELSVRDRGEGIAKDQLDHIFIPFFTTKPRGTGLGLAVCQRIIANHGGDIRVESERGLGTTFTVRLPARTRRSEPVARARGRGDSLVELSGASESLPPPPGRGR